MSPFLQSRLRRVWYSLASVGVRRTLADLTTHFTGSQRLSYEPERDTSFDRRFATDTAGSVQPAQLGIADSHRREQAILYLPSPTRVTRWMLESFGVEHRDFVFVDLGCGKGRVLLVASEYPFQRIVGVDISHELTAIARENARLYTPPTRRCPELEVVHADATTLEFPRANLWLHFYHPFEPAVTEGVLAQLERSLATEPRRVVIAYLLYAAAVEPVQQVFARFPWLKCVRHEQSVLGHYDWLFYTN